MGLSAAVVVVVDVDVVAAVVRDGRLAPRVTLRLDDA